MNRQEVLTQTLRAELDHLRNLVENNAAYTTSRTEHRQLTTAKLQPLGTHSPSHYPLSAHATGSNSTPQDNQRASDADRLRHDVRVSAIEELEQGHIPTNTLGDGARMLGMLSSARDTPTSARKRKHGGEMEDAKIAYAV